MFCMPLSDKTNRQATRHQTDSRVSGIASYTNYARRRLRSVQKRERTFSYLFQRTTGRHSDLLLFRLFRACSITYAQGAEVSRVVSTRVALTQTKYSRWMREGYPLRATCISSYLMHIYRQACPTRVLAWFDYSPN